MSDYTPWLRIELGGSPKERPAAGALQTRWAGDGLESGQMSTGADIRARFTQPSLGIRAGPAVS